MKKRCFKCERDLPRSEFYVHRQMADGLLGKCKDCTKKDVTKNRDAKIEKIRAYDRARGNRQKANRRTTEQIRAHSMVARAVKNGDLIKKPCEVCGSTSRVVAHHDDYNAALGVRWMCQKHHVQHHKGRRID